MLSRSKNLPEAVVKMFFNLLKLSILLMSLLFLSDTQQVYSEGYLPLSWQWSTSDSFNPRSEIVFHGDSVIVAGYNRVYSIDTKTGNTRWRFPSSEPFSGRFYWGPVLSGDLVVVAADYAVEALDAATGQSKWLYQAPKKLIAPPRMTSAFVVVALEDHSLVALYRSSGKIAWRTPYRIFEGIRGYPEVYQNLILVLTKKSTMLALDIVREKIIWEIPFTQFFADARPLVYGDKVYIMDGSFLKIFDPRNGRLIGSKDTRETPLTNPAVSVYGQAVISEEGNLVWMDQHQKEYRSKLFGFRPIPGTSLAWVGKNIITFDPYGVIQLFNPGKGELFWSYYFPEMVHLIGANSKPLYPKVTPPIYMNSMLFLWSSNGNLSAFNEMTGVDLTAPSIKMETPHSGNEVFAHTPFEVVFKFEDLGAGVDPYSLKVYLDGLEVKYRYFLDGKLHVPLGLQGQNSTLTPGRKVFKVMVADWLGNRNEHSFVLYAVSTSTQS